MITKRECVRYGGEEGHKAKLALAKLDGSPLPVMETLQSSTNKIYRYGDIPDNDMMFAITLLQVLSHCHWGKL